MIKSAYQRGREAALREFSTFLADVAARSRKAAYAKERVAQNALVGDQLKMHFDMGILVGVAVAHDGLLEIVESGKIPRLENILPAETQV